MQRRDIVINAVLVGIIVLLCYLIAVSTYEEPAAASAGKDENRREDLASVHESETQYMEVQDKYPHFGERPIFHTIISRPTPLPTQTPRPKPTPSLERATHYWRLASVSADEAMIEDTKLHQYYTLRLNESLTITYRNETLEITLTEINENTLSITVRYKDQTKTLKMF